MDTNKSKNNKKGESHEARNNKNNSTAQKKPFDKKKYRLQKYSNKYKVDQWEDRRKKAVLRNFYKDLRKEQGTIPDTLKLLKKPEDGSVENSSVKKKSPFFAAKEEFRKKKAEKQAKKELLLKSKEERAEALNKYKEKKKETYKKLSKKTKKGQPVMKDRLEMLLEKIKQSTSTE
ncbi:thyroid transcription factor 1-associated protein 26 homolog isoform X2 [Venturia canescens]|uniref:thyroid transcription factor 1-associated protein 26 homolog isoform X2 n=1 Tax=Venturia canescens TaxID=32260 RepID=UPI001C9C37D7|nr:thyroid transcription factor 1-associated protein 26 homolog isoform X2 [Venturia canescens]